jgi:hypothetical protein
MLQAARAHRSPAANGAWVAALTLLAGAIAYQEWLESGWLIKALILGAFALTASLARLQAPPLWSRNLLIVLGLALYRALSVDQRVLVLLGVALLAVVASGIRSGRSAAATALAASVAVLAHQSYFYEAGYNFSFSALDMTVVFAATRDNIHLGEGFVLLMVQHLGPWLVIASALIYNRFISDDRRGIAAAAFALLGTFVVQAWSVFVAFEYEVDNHWYTMHAVPMVVFALCNAGLVAVSVGAALAALDRRRATGAGVPNEYRRRL